MRKFGLSVLILLLLSGCSSTTFVYNRLNIILPWMLNGYVDMDSGQKTFLKGELQPFLDWHRMQELPAYVDIIDSMEVMLDEPVTVEHMAALVADFEQSWERLEERGLALLMGLGEQLDDEQIAEFMASLQEEQEEYQEKYLDRSDEEYYEESYENFADAAEDFLGKLSPEQKSALKLQVAQLQRSDHIWVQERAAWNTRLEQILQREPGWQQQLLDAVASRQRDISPEYRATYLHNSSALQLALVDLLNSRSEAQDRRVRKVLGKYRRDFETLVEQGAGDS
jgi:hypothetical protein